MEVKKNTYNHLTEEQRGIIRDMLYQGCSSREIGQAIGVSHTTVIREVKRNRVKQKQKNPTTNPLMLCKNYNICSIKLTTCERCLQKGMLCKRCISVACYKKCKHFEAIECPKTQKWPFICTANCSQAKGCRYTKYAYASHQAHKQYTETLKDSRSGAYLTDEQLSELSDLIVPFLQRGFSPYAALACQQDQIPVSVRTIYRYIHDSKIDCTLLHLPRMTRLKPKVKTRVSHKDKINRTGREYSDYLSLPKVKRERIWQMDTVCGQAINKSAILTIHNPQIEFQLMALMPKIHSLCVIKYLDYLESLLGSRERFREVFPGFLPDRGIEFNMYQEMERSSLEPGKKRCKFYYCDPGRADQKGSAEKNHEHIRSILPKGYVNFDALNPTDVANLCSHINSYPRESLGGKTPISLVEKLLPKDFLDTLGIEQVSAEDVVLKPTLIPHALL